MFCPRCGLKLIHIGQRKVYGKPSIDKEPKTLVSEIEKRIRKATGMDSYGTTTIDFVCCTKCKELRLVYYSEGIHLEYLGDLTDEFIRVLIAAGLKDKQ
jgi:hypothetical protein